MFGSASSCTPNSQVEVSFVASKNQILDISTDVTIAVNNVVIPTRPINIQAGQQVTALVISPPGFLQYSFFEYTLDNQKSYFAVVNKNDYQPTVKNADAPKRWFNYNTTDIRVSFYNGYNSFQHPLGFGRNIVDIASSHIVLDHIKNAVSFYGTDQSMITRVVLPAGPVEYRKYSYVIPQTGITTTEALILCTNNRLYRIRFDNQYFDSDTFTPTVIPVISLGNLWFEQDLPTGETFIEANQKRLLSKLSPALTALDIGPNKIWIAGYDSVFILNNNFQLTQQIRLTNQTIIAISAIGNDAILTTRSGQIIYLTASGSTTLLYTAPVLGSPTSINSNQQVVIPDPNNRRLLIFSDSSGTYDVWNTEDFAPAYARDFNGQLWVTGHDTNVALKFESPNQYQQYDFDYKVTIVSVVDGSILGINYLQNFVTLELSGIEKVVPISFRSTRGPRSHIGTDPKKIVCLGQEAVIPKTSPGLTCWVNGLRNEIIKTGDYVGISYRGENSGKFRSVLILGETAFDYDVEIVSSAKPEDYFYSTLTAYHRLPTTGNTIASLLPGGNLNVGINESINLPFTLNMYGNLYSNINVTTNGYITFGGNNISQTAGTIGSLGIDALYVEPIDLYQGLLVDNSNPLSITYSPASEEPGVYYQTGSVGQFAQLRVRWVGTVMSLRPNGTSVTVGNTIQNSTIIPVNTTDDVFVDDFISGGGIATPTKVVATSNFGPLTVNAYTANVAGNYFVVTRVSNFNAIPQNSWATVDGISKTSIISTDAILIRRNAGAVDTVLDYSSNFLIINGLISADVTNEYTVLLTCLASWSGISIIRKYDLLNISRITDTITCLNVIDVKTIEVGQADYEKVHVNQTVSNSSLRIVSKTLVNNQYQIEFNTGHNLNINDPINLEKTRIEFVSAVPSNVILYEKVGFELYKIFVNNVTQLSIGLDTSVVIQGNFITSNASVTLSSNDLLLCAPYRAVTPTYTYEVGFYSDGSYQYIEYFYDSTNHEFATPVGIATQNVKFSPVVTSVSSGNSVVFFSESSTGVWTELGQGTFDANTKGFISRNFIPEFVPAMQEPNTTTVEILIDQNIQPESNVLISATYGFLTVNNASYFGQSYITKDSLISLKVPFNDSLRTVAPIISIDSHQIAVPMKPLITSNTEANIFLPTYTTSYPSTAKNILVEDYITIPVSDSYFIPDYYRSSTVSSEIDLNYFLISNGNITRLDKGQSYELMAGDTIYVKNVITSQSIHDTRNALLVGPVILESSWRTTGPDLIDTILFDTLISPYQSNSEYIIEDGVIYDVGYRLYQSSNVEITADSNFNCNLFVDTYGSSILVNGVSVPDYWAVNVPVGSYVSITRDVFNILQQPIRLYQVLYDTRISSNVYVEIGNWKIENQVTTGSELIGSDFVSGEIQQILDTSSSSLTSSLDNSFDQQSITTSGLDQQLSDSQHTTLLPSIKNKNTVDTSDYSIFSPTLLNNRVDLNNRSTYIDSFKISVQSIPDSFKTTVFLARISVDPNAEVQKISVKGRIDNSQVTSSYKSSFFNTKLNLDSTISNYKLSTLIGKIDQDSIPANYKDSTIRKVLDNDKIVSNFRISMLESFTQNDFLPMNYRQSYIQENLDNSELPSNYKSSNYRSRLDNNEISYTYRSSTPESRIDNNKTPLNYLSSNYRSQIGNDKTPLTYLSSNYRTRIDNNKTPLNYLSSNYRARIDNNEMPLTYLSSNYRARIVNSSIPLDYRSSNYRSRIDNNEMPLTYLSSNYRSLINNDKIPVNYLSSNYTYLIDNNKTPLTYLSSNYRSLINNDKIPVNYLSSNYRLSIVNAEIPVNYRSSNYRSRIDVDGIPLNYSDYRTSLNSDLKVSNYKLSHLYSKISSDSFQLSSKITTNRFKFLNDELVINWKSTITDTPLKSNDFTVNWNLNILQGKNTADLNQLNSKSLSTTKLQADNKVAKVSLFKYKSAANSRVANEKLNWLTDNLNSVGESSITQLNKKIDANQIPATEKQSYLNGNIESEDKIVTSTVLKFQNQLHYESTTVPLTAEIIPDQISDETVIYIEADDFKIAGYSLFEVKKPDAVEDKKTFLAVPAGTPVTGQNSEFLIGNEVEPIWLNFNTSKLEVEFIGINTEFSSNLKGEHLGITTELLLDLKAIGFKGSEFYQRFNPEIISVTELSNKFDAEVPGLGTIISTSMPTIVDRYELIHFPLVGILDNVTVIEKSLIPLIDEIPPILLPLIPLWDRETLLTKELKVIPDDPTQIYRPLELKLDADPIWEQGFDVSSAYRTVIQIYANNGRGGDNITDPGPSPKGLPFVLYTQEYNYIYGIYSVMDNAKFMAEKFNSALAVPIVATDYWNYRIFFNQKHYCVPRKGRIFPVKWFIRGG